MEILSFFVYIITAMWTAYVIVAWTWIYIKLGPKSIDMQWPAVCISGVLYSASLAFYLGGV